MGTTGHLVAALGTFAGGDKHRYRFRVTLDCVRGQRLPGRQLDASRSPGTPPRHRPPLRDRAIMLARRVFRVVTSLLLAAGLLLGPSWSLPALFGIPALRHRQRSR